MRIGLLITSIGNFGEKGFYNAQEIGLAKELDKLFDEVIIYKAISISEQKSINRVDGCSHTTLHQIPVKSKGINGIWNSCMMDNTLDALIYFSDTQLAIPDVYKWCCRNNIRLYPYIGVIESHSTNAVKKLIINTMFKRNITVYKKCTCFVKTPTVAENLNALGVKDTVLTPVGLDVSLLHADFEKSNIQEIKKKYGYSSGDKVLLFIGRLIDEKQPVRMIEILAEIRKKNQSYKLIMVGTGELKNVVVERIKRQNLSDYVQMIDRIPNSDIWELYRMADSFINLNQQEIFGMAILEAMYYGCKVVAWTAPGPELIIEQGVNGWLVCSNKELIDCIVNQQNLSSQAHRTIIDRFTWLTTAKKMAKYIQKIK